MSIVIAIDAGTTGVRTVAIDETGSIRARAYQEFPQYFPQPGWVEHDPEEIFAATLSTLASVVSEFSVSEIVAMGITNQRETVVVWDRATGDIPHRAIVWQDRRTSSRCDELREQGMETLIRSQTGLVIDPYFSATKIEWLAKQLNSSDPGLASSATLAFSTIDTWLLWRLTGGTDNGVFATEPSNASRTMLFDIDRGDWSEELLSIFGVEKSWLPEIRPSSGRFGVTKPNSAAGLAIPISGIAGDQQAALFGQRSFSLGASKNTYGTGSFVLVNLGPNHPPPVPGLLTSVAWKIGDETTYVFEGSIFVTGAAVQWLRDGLNLIESAADLEPLAKQVDDSGGLIFVPALTGLGSPHWDPYARGTMLGITRGTNRSHLARAVIEAMAWQTRDVIEAMVASGGVVIKELRVDGGAAVMDTLCQLQADVLNVLVVRPEITETTVLGAAYLAGLAEGVWSSLSEIANLDLSEKTFTPQANQRGDESYERWTEAVKRSHWAHEST